jgi:hypothetical protein
MMNIENLCISQAATYLTVANTPLFLSRKLRLEPRIAEFSSMTDDLTLFEKLKTLLAHTPQTLEEEAKPYVYVVALAMKNRSDLLLQAQQIISNDYRWFSHVLAYLVSSITPTSATVVQNVGFRTMLTTTLAKSELSTNTQVVSVSQR